MIKKVNIFLTFVLILSITLGIVMHAYASNGRNKHNKIVDNKIQKEVRLKLKNNKDLDLQYKHTNNLPRLEESTIHTYINKNRDEFLFNNNKKIKAIKFKGKKMKNKLTYNVVELKRIAQKTIGEYLEIKDYDFDTYKYNKENSRYTFIWSKYINKIKTCDFIQLDIESNGDVISMITPYLGLYNKNDESKIEMTKNHIGVDTARDILDKVIKTKYSNLGELTLENYSVIEENLSFVENGKLAWQYFVEIKHTNNETDFSLGEYFIIDALSGELESIK